MATASVDTAVFSQWDIPGRWPAYWHVIRILTGKKEFSTSNSTTVNFLRNEIRSVVNVEGVCRKNWTSCSFCFQMIRVTCIVMMTGQGACIF